MELCERAVILSGGVIVADADTKKILSDTTLLAANRLELPVGFSLS
jgi:cobalt/nickel transport system ATP-binding protein